MTNINVTNVTSVSTLDLAMWVSENLLNIRLPIYGTNSTPNVKNDVVPLLPIMANRLALATEFYIVCAGVKASLSSTKKAGNAEEKADVAVKLININAHMDVLYRSIQTLESMRESASRMMTGLTKEYGYGPSDRQ